MDNTELIFLGTATSTGIPVIGCDCAVCQSGHPRNQRLRSSVYLRTPELAWVIDTGPDFRAQCLRERIRELDAVIYTHAHVDHIMGFDDLRRFTFGADERIPIHATRACLDDLERVFEYAFNGKNRYIAYVKPDPKPITGPFYLGTTEVIPLPVTHGKVETIGYLFRFQSGRRLAYIPDCKTIDPEAMVSLQGIDWLILDALRFRPHPTHMNFEEALATVEAVRPGETWLTHFACDVDHEKAEASLPSGVRMAYDGLKLNLA